jgi:class 3 adenylate cyclase
MKSAPKILVVDDNPKNVKLLTDLLSVKGYQLVTASNGAEALEKVKAEKLDLVLLDVVMPEMNGFEVCQQIRDSDATRLLPVVMVTAYPEEGRVKGIEAGADEFIIKPINQAELLARVSSLIRIKELHEMTIAQAAELAELNRILEGHVANLKRFFSPQVADLISSGTEDPLKSHRREVTVVFLDLRGFTPFAEASEHEEIIGVLHEYHAEMGKLIFAYEGTLEHFAGDGMMIFFNDPVPQPNHAERALRMAVAMRGRVAELKTRWNKLDYNLDFAAGIARGYATIGSIGFEGRWEYGLIGRVVNLAARLCGEAKADQILIPQRLLGQVEELVEAEKVGELTLKGFQRPVTSFNVCGLKG